MAFVALTFRNVPGLHAEEEACRLAAATGQLGRLVKIINVVADVNKPDHGLCEPDARTSVRIRPSNLVRQSVD